MNNGQSNDIISGTKSQGSAIAYDLTFNSINNAFNNITVSGNASVGPLSINGDTEAVGNITVYGGLGVAAATTLNDTHVNKSLIVDGGTTLNSTATIKGTLFASAIDATGNVTLGKNTSNTINVKGALTAPSINGISLRIDGDRVFIDGGRIQIAETIWEGEHLISESTGVFMVPIDQYIREVGDIYEFYVYTGGRNDSAVSAFKDLHIVRSYFGTPTNSSLDKLSSNNLIAGSPIIEASDFVLDIYSLQPIFNSYNKSLAFYPADIYEIHSNSTNYNATYQRVDYKKPYVLKKIVRIGNGLSDSGN